MNKVVLIILLASVVIQLVMFATQKFTTALIISGGTLALILLIKIYAAISRRRIKARTIDRERDMTRRLGGNSTFIDHGVKPRFVKPPPTENDNEDETFETPSPRSSGITSGTFSDYIDMDSDESSRGSTSNPRQRIVPIPDFINTIPVSFYKASEGVRPLAREVGSSPIGPVDIMRNNTQIL